MAFSPSAFKGAMGGPMGGTPPPPMGGAPKPGLDMESLMGEPGGEMGEPGDSMAEEGSETSLEAALETAGIQASPDQLNQIKEILGLAGGAIPSMSGDETEPGGLGAPEVGGAPKFNSKLGKMFGK